jgi:hypothetical protein
MKYLIVKGAMGFGDRLQSLKMCVKYAIKHNLQIYVDWSDPIWCHNNESFYDYFKFVNMPVLQSLDQIPEDATVHPAVWKGLIKGYPKIDLNLTHKDFSLGYIQDQVFDADVIVYLCNSVRWIYNDSVFFGHVFRVVDQRIIQKVKYRQERYNLKNAIGIHLRGTDRATKIDKSYRMAGLNIRLVTKGLLNGQKFVAVSDDPEYIEIWKSRYEFPVLTELGNLGGKEGVHQKTAEQLTVSKDQLNMDLLVDFFTLMSCKEVISTSKDSRFAQEAIRLNPFVNQMCV